MYTIVYMKHNNDNTINNDNSNNNDHDDNNKMVLKFCYRFLTAERESRRAVSTKCSRLTHENRIL